MKLRRGYRRCLLCFFLSFLLQFARARLGRITNGPGAQCVKSLNTYQPKTFFAASWLPLHIDAGPVVFPLRPPPYHISELLPSPPKWEEEPSGRVSFPSRLSRMGTGRGPGRGRGGAANRSTNGRGYRRKIFLPSRWELGSLLSSRAANKHVGSPSPG